jgi:putative transposase
LKRYDKQGIEGLKDKPKIGRRPEISVEVEHRIKTNLKEGNTSWTAKQVEELII